MLAILNSLAEYFHMINGKIQPKEPSSNMEKKAIYVIYRGKTPRIYVSYEAVIAQQIGKKRWRSVLKKKYLDIDQAKNNLNIITATTQEECVCIYIYNFLLITMLVTGGS